MIINLDDTMRVNVIPMNFVLEKRVTVKPKDKPEYEDWRALGYYPSFERVLRAIPDHLMRSPDIEDIQGLRAAWDALSAKIVRSVGGVK